MLRRSARARVVAKDEEKETTREGRPGGSTNAVDYLYSKKVEIQQVRCHFCQEENIEGTHKYVN